MKTYRPGAVGALIDIYEQTIADFKKMIEDIPDPDLTVIVDPETNDEDCRSIQTILSHVVHSGFGYATSIYNRNGAKKVRPEKKLYSTTQDYLEALDKMFGYTEAVFREISNSELVQNENSLKIKTGWGQLYDIEQLTEHAIVHLLRHQRQIERFKCKLLISSN